MRIYANAVKDRNQKIEAQKELIKNSKLEMESMKKLEIENIKNSKVDIEYEDDILSEGIMEDHEDDFDVEIITC